MKHSGPTLVFSGCSGDIISIDQPVLLPAHTPTQQKALLGTFGQDNCAESRLAGMNPSRESESLYLYVPNGPSGDKMKNPIIDVAVGRRRRISGAGSSSVEMTEASGRPPCGPERQFVVVD